MATIIINGGSHGDIVSTQITDSTLDGRSILTAADYAAMRALLNVSLAQTTITKSADESRTSTTTISADAELLFNAEANSVYEIQLYFVVTGTVAAGGLRLGLLLPASARAMMFGRTTVNTTFHSLSNTGVISGVITAAQMLDTQDCWFNARVRTLETAGNVTLSWAQNANNANPVTIAAGSTLSYRKL